MTVQLDIGPTGQPPSTTYTYLLGEVTLSARPATQRTAAELAQVVRSIRLFHRAVPAASLGQPSEPFTFEFKLDGTVLECQFKCPSTPGNLNLTASLDLTTRVTSFDERPERVIAWGDFDLFYRWMMALSEFASR